MNSADELELYSKAYIDLIGRLSRCLHGLDWWAHPLSEKNEHGSTFYAALIQEHRSKGAAASNCNPAVARVRTLLLPIRLFFSVLNGLCCCLAARLFLGVSYKRWLKLNQPAYLLRSWVSVRAFVPQGDYDDPYFSPLIPYLRSRGFKVLVLAGVQGSFWQLLGSCIRSHQAILPEVFFLHPVDFLAAAFAALTRRIRICGNTEFRGVDVSKLIDCELRRGYASSAVYFNLLRYWVGRRVAAAVPGCCYLQPFENYAWEKSMISGLRSQPCLQPGSIYGFQHAFICRDSFKYFPAAAEELYMPLPDRIVTLGECTRRLLAAEGRYCSVELRVGCALRQGGVAAEPLLPRPHSSLVLVPLTMVRTECLKIISFLEASAVVRRGFTVALRFHPLYGKEKFGRLLRLLPEGFLINTDRTAAQAISRAGAVAYTWSTLAVEALKRGVPVVHLDILRPLRVDPLFECRGLSASVHAPAQLAAALERTRVLSEERFQDERAQSQSYLKEYFAPLDEHHLSAFVPGGCDRGSVS